MKKKVVIIGAGGAGLAASSAMLEAGFEVELIERSAQIGGIWASTRYPNLSIHSKSFNYRFIDFEPLIGKGERATREEILDYMRRFTESRLSQATIRFNTEVEKIVYKQDAATRKCEVHARSMPQNDLKTIECDFVVCALGFSNGGRPHKPGFNGSEKFRGAIVHSSEFTDEMFDDVIENRKKVVVYGAGKSSHEILSLFEDQPQIDVNWIYRKSLWAISFEKMYDSRKLYRFIAMFSYYLFLCSLRRRIGKFNRLLQLLERPLIWRRIFLNPLEPGGNIFQNRMAIMRAGQYEYLRSIRSIKTEITELNSGGVRLSNGQTIPADYLICATGYERASNMPRVLVVHDGALEYNYAAQHSFYLNMIDPKLPEVALFTANIIYSQQLFGFSIAAQWLAQFFAGTLKNGPSIQQIEHSLLQQNLVVSPWCSDQYLSRGGPYYFDKDNFVMGGILKELGIDRKLILHLLMYSTHEERFNVACERIRRALGRSA